MAVKKRLGKFGSRFAFEFFVEMMHERIVEALHKYLRGLGPKDITSMVSEGRTQDPTHIMGRKPNIKLC
ncbi:unnamed protein product [marine sediment metagenome]|uniref:Uncharacterized protein n=1 Tax=marine sediment metagenome TaxID=412755 RepID=X1R1W5_9ZZZZ